MRKYSKRVVRYIYRCGFKEEFTYLEENIPNDINKEKNKKYDHKNRKRKIIWSNPPFCRLACINVGKYFFKLIDKHFKHDNILHKMFNRKTLKISYSCTKNIFQIINNHNKEIIKEFQDRTNNNNNNNNNSKQNECNCKTRNNCPMNGLCYLKKYISRNYLPKRDINDRKTYIGISSTKWKIRYAYHKYSFFHEHLKHQTARSKHFWSLKNKGLTPEIQWSILKRSNTSKCFDNKCNLCLEEKIQILLYPEPGKLLNKRCE